ncbi:hypothetical protein [Kitasatospora sp. NPDC059327]|uniref:hypothetical protein n=1 Tax=Kitasatospora sp. NPDC059327 TaxID=3346803 RepID=UPI0036B6E83A
MTDPAPRPLSRRSVLRGAAVLGAASAAGPLLNLATARPAFAADPVPAPDGTAGSYTIRFDQAAKQTIRGLGFEIQSDSIASGNAGLPTAVSGVPYDLTPSERTRFYQQMLKGGRTDHGFRYCRLALGLYHRGVDASGKHLQDRYTGQTALLADMVQQAGLEGVAAEYWSPAPGWKANNSFVGAGISLASFAPADLSALGDAMVADLNYLSSRGVPITMWGLQNEPHEKPTGYSSCYYTTDDYVKAFKAVAPKIKAAYPNVMIHADSWDGWQGEIGTALREDPAAAALVDAWTFHKIGQDSDYQLRRNYTSGAGGKACFNNEFEYLSGNPFSPEFRCINTAQSIMNWMTFQNSPTWFWLHALKPTTNSESKGYGLGFWRPPQDTNFNPDHFPDLPVGHWTWNPENWNAVCGFLKYMPWDSVRYGVDEPLGSDGKAYKDHRIMAWRTTQGKPVLVITNRNPTETFTYTINTQTTGDFRGNRFGPTTNNQYISAKTGPVLTISVPPRSIEFWVHA